MAWRSPFALPGHWLKGNLHTHTTQSDGEKTPEQAAAWYRDHGYDFLAISDHWVQTPSGIIEGLPIVAAAELNGAGYHMLALGIDTLPERELADDPQAMIDHIASEQGLAFIAHPYWMGQTSGEIAALHGLTGVEVFNSVCEAMDGLGHARVHWDDLLAADHRLWGLAVDDVHWRQEVQAQGQGFVMVRVEDASPEAILEALRAGAFYSSTGPALLDLRVEPGDENTPSMLRVRTSPCQTITFYASASYGRRFRAAPGAVIDAACIPINTNQVYLRVECCDARGRIAWSNPVFVADLLAD